MNTLPFTPPYFGFTSNSDLPIKTGLKAWYDYRKGITLDTTGSTETVKEIKDLSGNRYHLAQNNKDNQPIYTSSGILLQKIGFVTKLFFLDPRNYQRFSTDQTTIVVVKTVGAKAVHTGKVDVFSMITGTYGFNPGTPTENLYGQKSPILITNSTGQLNNEIPAGSNLYPNGANFNTVPSKSFISSCRTELVSVTPSFDGSMLFYNHKQQLTLNGVDNTIGLPLPYDIGSLFQWNGFRISGQATIDISDNFLLQEIIHYDRTLNNDENKRVLRYLQNKYSVIY